MSITTLSAVAFVVSMVNSLAIAALAAVAWQNRGHHFNQWEDALYQQWREQEPDTTLEARLAALSDRVDDVEDQLVLDLVPDEAPRAS